MGLFDKLKDKAKGLAGDALQAAVETAQDKVKDAVSDKLADVTQQAAGGALARVGVVPGSSTVTDAAQAATHAAVETGVNMAADAATAKVSGEQQGGEAAPTKASDERQAE